MIKNVERYYKYTHAKNRVGDKYGKLTVISLTKSDGKMQGPKWVCKCDCGKIVTINAKNLISNRTRSCGCLAGEIQTLENGGAAKNSTYSAYKASAARRSLSFTLTFEEFLKLTSLPCYYCGKPPSNIMKNINHSDEDFIYQGIDRENNEVGYTRSNSVPCCFECNKAKGIKSHIEFLSYIIKVYKYSIEDVRKNGQSL